MNKAYETGQVVSRFTLKLRRITEAVDKSAHEISSVRERIYEARALTLRSIVDGAGSP